MLQYPKQSNIISGKDGCFQWNIADDFSIWWKDGLNKSSPSFTFLDAEYRIILQRSRDTLCLILHHTDWSPLQPLYVGYQMSKYSENRTQLVSVTSRSTVKDVLVAKIGVSKYLSTSNAFQFEMHSFTYVYPLTLFWQLKKLSEEPQEVREKLQIAKLQEDLKKLLLSQEDNDIILKVEDKTFPAHRNILRARSTVFNAMFSHKMKEQLNGDVTIRDTDPKVFPYFLNYLYTGSTKFVSEENVCQLYITSDKYDVGELKAECAAFMKNHFTIEGFCDFFSLALLYNDIEVINSATEFFYHKAPEIVKNEKWQKS